MPTISHCSWPMTSANKETIATQRRLDFNPTCRVETRPTIVNIIKCVVSVTLNIKYWVSKENWIIGINSKLV
jgi:hypothetical protein